MDQQKINEIREKLKQFVTPDEGLALREILAQYAKQTYIPKNPESEYFRYMNMYECRFTKNGAQSTNFPQVWCMFSIPAQHVRGDCIEECLDKAIEYENGKPRLIGCGTDGNGSWYNNVVSYNKVTKSFE